MSEDSRSELRLLLNPVVMLALIIVLSIIALIGAAVLGIDKGVLSSMAKPEYARGLVTYLFAVVTIGTAVVLVLSALLGTEDEVHEKRFQRGKEILSLLLGVFGVIVGYYFGAEKSGARVSNANVRIVAVEVAPSAVHVGEKVTLRASVTGGTPPYSFAAGQDDDNLSSSRRISEGQLLDEELVVHTPKMDASAVIHLKVADAAGDQVESQAQIRVLRPEEH